MPSVSTSLLPAFLSCSCALLRACGLLGCGPEGDVEIEEAEALYFEPIGRGQSATVADSLEIVIRDSLTWVVYQDSLQPMRSFEDVDFTQAMVLLVALPMTTSGYLIDFISVEKVDDTVTASYLVTEPGEDCLVGVGETEPFQAVLVRRDSSQVRFDRHRRDYPCRTE